MRPWKPGIARISLMTLRTRRLLVASRIGVPDGADPRPPADRDVATAVTSVVCAGAGVWGVRVHDVAGTRDAFAVLQEVAAHR